jgi:cytochrome P450
VEVKTCRSICQSITNIEMIDSILGTWSLEGLVVLAILSVFIVSWIVISPLFNLSDIPGPKLYAISKWRLAYDEWKGTRTRSIHQLHQVYGPVVRIGPNEISFNSPSALKTIYGAGSGFERTSFYRMFDVYGQQNLFTFGSPKAHGERKKLLNHAYSKSSILKISAQAVEEKAREFMELLTSDPNTASEIFSSLHYYSLDNITHFLYGPDLGGTSAMVGSQADRALLNDVLDPARRKLAWFAVHFPQYTKWLMTRTGMTEKVVAALGLLPQQKPTVYTGIRQHALSAWQSFLATSSDIKTESKKHTIMGRLWEHHISQKQNGLQDLEIASEAADHLLAGVDTTSDSLMFLIWALSLPKNLKFQEKLIQEVTAMSTSMLDGHGIPTAEETGKLPYLDAVIKETLRLYAPLPASEPRSLPIDCVIDGYKIPANTVVGMSPYSLHRKAEVFPDPLVFNPERWLGDAKDVAEMKKWFWAFSSGGRMCIGLQ